MEQLKAEVGEIKKRLSVHRKMETAGLVLLSLLVGIAIYFLVKAATAPKYNTANRDLINQNLQLAKNQEKMLTVIEGLTARARLRIARDSMLTVQIEKYNKQLPVIVGQLKRITHTRQAPVKQYYFKMIVSEAVDDAEKINSKIPKNEY